MKITISGKDKKRMELIEKLAEELGLSIFSKSSDKKREPNGQSLYKLMKEKAESGGISEIEDPVKWQREQRKDKPLYGRE